MSQMNYQQQLGYPQRRRRPAAMATTQAPADETAIPAADYPQPATIRRVEIDLSIAHVLGGAAGPIILDIAGTTVWCAKSSDAAICDVQIDSNDPVPFMLHYNIQGTPFRRLQVTNAAQAGKTVTLIVINDPDNRIEVQ